MVRLSSAILFLMLTFTVKTNPLLFLPFLQQRFTKQDNKQTDNKNQVNKLDNRVNNQSIDYLIN